MSAYLYAYSFAASSLLPRAMHHVVRAQHGQPLERPPPLHYHLLPRHEGAVRPAEGNSALVVDAAAASHDSSRSGISDSSGSLEFLICVTLEYWMELNQWI